MTFKMEFQRTVNSYARKRRRVVNLSKSKCKTGPRGRPVGCQFRRRPLEFQLDVSVVVLTVRMLHLKYSIIMETNIQE